MIWLNSPPEIKDGKITQRSVVVDLMSPSLRRALELELAQAREFDNMFYGTPEGIVLIGRKRP
jgi:hypothetical protein